MSVSDRRKRESEKLRLRVLDVAEEIVAREGAQHVTMRRIASAVEYAPTLLYRLFADKHDLMDHLIARGYGGVRTRYEEVLCGEDMEPLQALAGILEVYVAYALEHPNHYRMWFDTGEMRLEKGRLTMRHGRLEFVVFQTWLDSFEACREVGHFPSFDSLQIFQSLWPRVHGLISLRLQHPEFPWPPIRSHLEDVLDLDCMAER